MEVSNYEIIVLENNNLISQKQVEHDVIEIYIKTCREYINPSSSPKNDIKFNNGKMFLKYSDNTKSVMLLGSISDDIVIFIKEILRKFYYNNCSVCNAETSLFWTLCDKCKKT
jgi:hypothetical protein